MFSPPSLMASSGVLVSQPAYTPVHNSANVVDEDTRHWAPSLQSFDEGFLLEKDLLNARTEDVLRNSPLDASAIRAQINKMIGGNYRMSFEPDYVSAGMTAGEALKFVESVERVFACDAESEENYFDASGRMNFTEVISCGYYCMASKGELVQINEWLEKARKQDKRPFATAVQVINSDRVHTPPMEDENKNLKAGFRMSNKGYAFGMYVLNRHPGDFRYENYIDDHYAYITRHTPWRRQKWMHAYTQEAADQSRGRSQFIAGLRTNKAFAKLSDAMLSNVILQTLYAAVIESPDPVTAMQGLMAADQSSMMDLEKKKQLLHAKGSYYSDGNEIVLNRAKVAHMFPGDEFKFMQGNKGLEFYDPYQATVARVLARTHDVSYEEYTGDYTKTNYSGARAGTNQSDTSREAIAARSCAKQARNIATLWIEEQCALGRIDGVPGRTARQRLNWFLNHKHAISRFSFFGPGIKHIDPVKSTEAAINERKMRTLSLKAYYNNHTDMNWRQGLDQIALENEYAEANGIDIDAGLGIAPEPPPAQTAPPAQKEEAA